MSLIVCPECRKEFSDKAPACPNCGCPTEEALKGIRPDRGDSSPLSKKYSNDLLHDYLTQVVMLETDLYTMQRLVQNLHSSKKTFVPAFSDIGEEPNFDKIRDDYINRYMAQYQELEWKQHESFYGYRASSNDWDVQNAKDIMKTRIDSERENCLKKWEWPYKDKADYIRNNLRFHSIKNPFTLKKRMDEDYEWSIKHTEKHNAEVDRRNSEIQSRYDSAVAIRNQAIEYNEQVSKKRLQITEYNCCIDRQIEQVQAEVNKTLEALSSLYSIDVIYPKYRSIVPVTMFLEYMESGRRNVLEGIDGMYDLYESEILGQKIITELGTINQNLSLIRYQINGIANQLNGIARNQILLHEEVARANETAKQISNTTSSILEKNVFMEAAMGDIAEKLSAVQSSVEVSTYNSEITAHRIEAIAKIQEYEHSLRYSAY